ncbi:unnamed protein product [Lactuca virosa]|uniref:Uncharacterized protein n=1 Tax=Lactuca virosa TaxID=75947 RepID=A0AAU9MJY8_9ASTR|nr:unnamed protein product [Lactuca virosa]
MHTVVKVFMETDFFAYLHLGELDMARLRQSCDDSDNEDSQIEGGSSHVGASPGAVLAKASTNCGLLPLLAASCLYLLLQWYPTLLGVHTNNTRCIWRGDVVATTPFPLWATCPRLALVLLIGGVGVFLLVFDHFGCDYHGPSFFWDERGGPRGDFPD